MADRRAPEEEEGETKRVQIPEPEKKTKSLSLDNLGRIIRESGSGSRINLLSSTVNANSGGGGDQGGDKRGSQFQNNLSLRSLQ